MTTSDTLHDPAGADEDRRLSTIRGLLAKAEATDFPDEAEAFFAKASELISRWAIDEAVLWASSDSSRRESPDELQLVVHAPYLAQKAVLVSTVAAAHDCRAVRLVGGSGGSTEVISVVGFPSELRWVETLATSLLVQLTSAMLASSPSTRSASATASWRRSFIAGFADEVGRRLQRDREQAQRDQERRSHGDRSGVDLRDGGRSVSLVLADRRTEVDGEFRRRHPYVRSSWASSGSSHAGRDAGRRAGRDAALTRDRIGGRRRLGP